jgi:hypothetical protein
VVLATVVALATTSAVAYAAFGPIDDSGPADRTRCDADGSSCSGQAPPATSPANSRRPHATRSHLPPAAGASPSTKAPEAQNGTVFAPYVDFLYYPVINLAASARAAGIKHYNLAFIVAGNGCTPSWGGTTAVDSATLIARVRAFRAAGGDIRISFGGESGTELAAACSSAEELASAYQTVIDAYSATKIDFDVEGSELGDTAANDRRNKAIAILQRTATSAGKTLNVSMTLPVGPNGLTAESLSLLNNAASDNTTIDVVNIMAMDYGDDAAPNPDGQMGSYAISAMKGTHTQLKSVFGLSDGAAWRRVAVTPLIGVNEPASEVFTVSDAAKVTAFAKSKHAAFVSMWSISRDKPCADGVTANATQDSCAGEADTAYAFSNAFRG